jgi:hypothetical protein
MCCLCNTPHEIHYFTQAIDSNEISTTHFRLFGTYPIFFEYRICFNSFLNFTKSKWVDWKHESYKKGKLYEQWVSLEVNARISFLHLISLILVFVWLKVLLLLILNLKSSKSVLLLILFHKSYLIFWAGKFKTQTTIIHSRRRSCNSSIKQLEVTQMLP